MWNSTDIVVLTRQKRITEKTVFYNYLDESVQAFLFDASVSFLASARLGGGHDSRPDKIVLCI
jgi:hypothetical protein